MEKGDIRKSIENIITNSTTGVMATVKGNKPHSRYMTFYHKDLTLYTPTSRHTDKTEEVTENPYTHILLGYEGKGFNDTYVEYEGEVSITEDEELKNKLWNDRMKAWFNGPNDPDLIVLEIKPNQIHLMNKKGSPPKTLEL